MQKLFPKTEEIFAGTTKLANGKLSHSGNIKTGKLNRKQYTFTLPDADGKLERDRLNARWCENIKHRSDNWDRNSNESATGLEPYKEPFKETKN